MESPKTIETSRHNLSFPRLAFIPKKQNDYEKGKNYSGYYCPAGNCKRNYGFQNAEWYTQAGSAAVYFNVYLYVPGHSLHRYLLVL